MTGPEIRWRMTRIRRRAGMPMALGNAQDRAHGWHACVYVLKTRLAQALPRCTSSGSARVGGRFSVVFNLSSSTLPGILRFATLDGRHGKRCGRYAHC